jgi:hypothetical protein
LGNSFYAGSTGHVFYLEGSHLALLLRAVFDDSTFRLATAARSSKKCIVVIFRRERHLIRPVCGRISPPETVSNWPMRYCAFRPKWSFTTRLAVCSLWHLYSGVLQGSCRVSRVFKLLFSLPAAPSLG